MKTHEMSNHAKKYALAEDAVEEGGEVEGGGKKFKWEKKKRKWRGRMKKGQSRLSQDQEQIDWKVDKGWKAKENPTKILNSNLL